MKIMKIVIDFCLSKHKTEIINFSKKGEQIYDEQKD